MQIRPLTGPLDYWTMQTRRVRLFPDDAVVELPAVEKAIGDGIMHVVGLPAPATGKC
ncbi:hypothetical protein [Streptomyces sp. NPDC056061]|uniref:hypothetical protein n=1 Tax=Streptomyces sp. NPDC056061 TaxID=3345700 RepID=UPI0035E04624